MYSKDTLPERRRRRECGIVNLDTWDGPGTHWVCYRGAGDGAEYFDSFGLAMPQEVARYLGPRAVYSGDEIQERLSVLCGWWCLYFLLERQRGTPLLDVLHNPLLGAGSRRKAANHAFIRRYFGLA